MDITNNGHGQYVVAHIDLLGAKQLIKQKDSAQLVRKIYDITLKEYDCGSFDGGIVKPSVKIFSDNIAIYNKVKDPLNFANISCAFMPVVLFASTFQLESLKQNVLVRGGIVFGDFYADDIMIWGEALAQADYLEKEIAIYPRIVVDPRFIDIIEYPVFIIENPFLTTDHDGLWFVDYINTFTLSASAITCKTLALNFNKIKERAGNDIRAQQKVAWHYRYLNSRLTKIT